MALLPSGIAKTGVVPFQIYPKTIDQSLRFEDGDSPYLRRVPSTTGNTQTWTFSAWVKRGNLGVAKYIFTHYDNAGEWTVIQFDSSDRFSFLIDGVGIGGGTGSVNRTTTAKYRDPSAWYHIVVQFDTTQAVANDRAKLYVNGDQITEFDTIINPNQNDGASVNTAGQDHRIGNWAYASSPFDGYMAEVHFTDGTAYTADDFGELKSGIWVPKDVDVTYGTNGFYLDFADGAAIGDDESGNTNDFTVNNLVASDVVPDSPTNNFATVNPISAPSGFVTSEGNLTGSGTNYNPAPATFAIPLAGKWYFEYLLRGAPYNNAFNGTFGVMGLIPEDIVGSFVLNEATSFLITDTGIVRNFSTTDTDSILTVSGSLIGLAVNMDAHQVSVYHDNTLVDTFDLNVAEGTTLFPMLGNQGTARGNMIMNFGQDSTFAGAVTAGGNSDANGIGDFAYAPPSGYLALCTSNLPDPVIDPAQEATADQHFNVYTYVGNGASQLVGDVVREIPDTVSIDQSLRFDHAGSTYLTFDPIADGDKTEWTFSTWFKRTGAEARMIFGQGTNGSNNRDVIYSEAAGELQVASYGGSYVFQFVTDRIFNDSAAWYHLVVAYDSSEATDTDRVKIWVNGLLITNFSTNNKPALNASTAHFNSGSPQYIGRYIDQGAHWNGYQAETHWIDGTAYAATDFGAFDADGIWAPITPSVTHGANGWHIDYSAASYTDNGSDPDTFADQANSNDFSAYGIAAEDIVPDTPTNQFAVLNQNDSHGDLIFKEGNLNVVQSTATTWRTSRSAFGVTSGKWYWEYLKSAATEENIIFGLTSEKNLLTTYIGSGTNTSSIGMGVQFDAANNNLKIRNGNSDLPSVSIYNLGASDVLQVAYDADAGKAWIGINNTWIESGDPASGTNQTVGSIPASSSEVVFPAVSIYTTSPSCYLNFGQDSTFAGSKTAASNADENGYGEFQYAPPSGFLALCENNLIQYDDNPLESPDFVWIKTRNAVVDHRIFDSVRGVNAALKSNTTSTEATEVDSLTSFNKNGFTIGNHASVNTSGSTYVAWTWKAGGTAVLNEDGSIDSQVSANTDAGFSIVSYTGNNTAGATVGHGLSSAPEMIIVKERTNDGGWWSVYHKDSTATGTAADTYLQLNATATSASWNGWNDTPPTASVFSLGNYDDVNGPSDTYIAYCFHSVDGFSKCGSYIGNGSADGPFVYTGHRSRFLLMKRTNGSASSWYIWDTERDPDNQAGLVLLPNSSGAEIDYTSTNPFDFLSNGFKVRATSAAFNNSGNTYVFYSAAEQPFKYSNAR